MSRRNRAGQYLWPLGWAISADVSFLVRPRTESPGHFRALRTVGFGASCFACDRCGSPVETVDTLREHQQKRPTEGNGGAPLGLRPRSTTISSPISDVHRNVENALIAGLTKLLPLGSFHSLPHVSKSAAVMKRGPTRAPIIDLARRHTRPSSNPNCVGRSIHNCVEGTHG